MNRTSRHPVAAFARAGVVAAAVTLLASLAASAWAASVPNPTVTGPIASPDTPGAPTHNYPFFASNHDLAARGYVEEEHYFQGTANRYTTPALATGAVIDGGHPYLTRMLVRRPADLKKFNGTVWVEWLNVTNGFDADNQSFSWEHILAAGYAWVGVSAQQVGVARLQTWNPTRYGALNVNDSGAITGDALSYDIFSQAGQAIKHPVGVDPLGGLKVRHMIAIGELQSAFRLATYVNSINPLANVYDGFVLLSTLGNQFRTDLMVPVWKILTEFDVENWEANWSSARHREIPHLGGGGHLACRSASAQEPRAARTARFQHPDNGKLVRGSSRAAMRRSLDRHPCSDPLCRWGGLRLDGPLDYRRDPAAFGAPHRDHDVLGAGTSVCDHSQQPGPRARRHSIVRVGRADRRECRG